MGIAALWGTSVGYSLINDSVLIETGEGRVAVIRSDVFEYLYFKLDDYTAALKENCIGYFIYDPCKSICEYPAWVIRAMRDNWIVEDEGSFIFVNDTETITLDNTSVILRNFMGELKYMDLDEFCKYYDILGE